MLTAAVGRIFMSYLLLRDVFSGVRGLRTPRIKLTFPPLLNIFINPRQVSSLIPAGPDACLPVPAVVISRVRWRRVTRGQAALPWKP